MRSLVTRPEARARLVDGVNLIGYLRTESGVGAAARSYFRALQALPIAIAPVDVSDLSGNRAEDHSLVVGEAEQLYPVNLVCTDIDLHFAMWSKLGAEFFSERYNVGIWAWELPRFPERWYDRFAYYDEIWVGTSFIANMLAPVAPIPVIRVPPVLATGERGSRERGRSRLGVSPDELVYLFVFDFHSRLQRKNPLAVIEAFRRAFAPSDRVRLVIKCVNPGFDEEGYARLRARADGYPVAFYDDYWTTTEMRDLMAACDVYVSLHRSEGTGLTIADAMALGKPAIATDWSGNLDFMNVANSFLVQADLVEIREDVGQYRAGETWAEPSIDHAAELMRFVYTHPGEAEARGRRAQREIEAHFSIAAVSNWIQQRLTVIASRQRFGQLRHDLRAPIHDLEHFLDRYRDIGPYLPARQLRYERTIGQIRQAVQAVVPTNANVLVVSRGDEDLLKLDGRQAQHFPQTDDGVFAGHYPADDEAAIAHLEALRAAGGQFLVLPNPAFWWLDYYPEFARHLANYRRLWSDDTCQIFALADPSAHRRAV